MSTGGVHEREAWRMSTCTMEMSCGEVLGCCRGALCRSMSLYGVDVPPLGYMFPYLVPEVVPVELIINQCVRLLIKGSPWVWLGVAFPLIPSCPSRRSLPAQQTRERRNAEGNNFISNKMQAD